MPKKLDTILACIALCFACATAASTANPPAGGPPPDVMKMMSKVGPQHPAGLPKDVQPVSGCIPTMGYHYANPKNLPFGPIYGWYNGTPMFTEIMVTPKQWASGSSWNEQLKPLPGYHVDHVDIWWEAHGHPGFPVPHYDLHAWYVTHAE
jgi:hypothetical protein